ncbi:MAG: SPOR domain-containing protein [Magnetococcales bacterium]|nr:SPOR domain-containing protein [Magnetococcales bacterium]
MTIRSTSRAFGLVLALLLALPWGTAQATTVWTVGTPVVYSAPSTVITYTAPTVISTAATVVTTAPTVVTTPTVVSTLPSVVSYPTVVSTSGVMAYDGCGVTYMSTMGGCAVMPAMTPAKPSQYSIRVGSYILYRNVNDAARRIAAAGLQPYQLLVNVKGINYVRVYAGVFPNKKSAHAKVAAVKAKFADASACAKCTVKPDVVPFGM